MRIFRFIIPLLAAVLCLGSCSLSQDAEGGDLIKAARKAYKELQSAHVIMTNTSTGEVEQEFTFKYDEKDILIFSYYGKSSSSEYAQYNNGVECYTYENGDLSYVHKGEEGFVLYNRATTHPQADEGLIIYSPQAITEATVTEEDGITHVCHQYDVKKIKAEAEHGEVTSFRADYYFRDDELLYFVETTGTKEDGEDKEYSYKVEITEKNSVGKVENTVKRFE